MWIGSDTAGEGEGKRHIYIYLYVYMYICIYVYSIQHIGTHTERITYTYFTHAHQIHPQAVCIIIANLIFRSNAAGVSAGAK